jgi:hypothetical protein
MIFSCNLCVQSGSEAHPVSCAMGTGGPFPGAKRGRGVTLTTHPHLVPRSRISRSYSSSPPPNTTMACSGTALLFFALSSSNTFTYTFSNILHVWPLGLYYSLWEREKDCSSSVSCFSTANRHRSLTHFFYRSDKLFTIKGLLFRVTAGRR